MRSLLLIAVAALVSIASAKNLHRRHNNLHGIRGDDAIVVTDWEVATVIDWETTWCVQSYSDAPRPSLLAQATTHVAEFPEIKSTLVQSLTANEHDLGTNGGRKASGDESAKNRGGSDNVSIEGPNKQSVRSDTISSSVLSSTTEVGALPNTTSSAQALTVTLAQQTATPASKQGASDSVDMIPNGRKAGLSGYVGIQILDAFLELAPHISWYSDYTPNPPTTDNVTGIGMLWGARGSPCGIEVAHRLAQFKKIVAEEVPRYMFGFYEPDCYCADSSQMSASSGTAQWNELIAPLGEKGTILGSPSMCKQKDEDWLQPFVQGGLNRDWQITSVHINKPDLQGIKEDIEYYASTYKRPIWVSEFACVHDQGGWQPCTDQNEIDRFINEAVKFFQENDTVIAYGPSNGNGLGNVWPLTDAEGKLTASGRTYLNAIEKL